jgi:Protein of unknown function (DUF1570)
MRCLVTFLLIAVGSLGILCSSCRSSQPAAAFDPAQRILESRLGPSAGQDVRIDPPAEAALDAVLAGPLVSTRTKHFDLLHKPGASFATLAGTTLERAYQHFYEVFGQAGFDLSRPADRLIWICFPQKSSFDRYALRVEGMDLSWLDGYYSTLTNRVAIVQADEGPSPQEETAPVLPREVRVAVAANRSPREDVLPMAPGPQFDVTRLTHEAAHQLSFNSGLQKRGVMYPLWVSEGLATNFEFSGGANPGLDRANLPRRNGLCNAYATGGLTPLRQFVVQTTVPPDASVGRRYYAQAWGFFRFLLTEHPEALRAYLRQLAQTRPERRDALTMFTEFTQAFGPLAPLESAWYAFLARQVQQAATARIAAPAETGAGASSGR